MAHLLIVDDEESICWGFAKLAAEMGHTADTAASAEEGLKLAGAARPDVPRYRAALPWLVAAGAVALALVIGLSETPFKQEIATLQQVLQP